MAIKTYAELQASPIFEFRIPVTAAANSTAASFIVPFPAEIIDITVQARATVSNGTAKVRKGTSDISDAIIMAVDTTITHAATINDAYSTLAAGDNLNVITANAGDRGIVSVFVKSL